jgi:eukaryotic-like serine/threonine-protein kinase
MPSDSVASFLTLARSGRLLVPELVEELPNHPDAPQANLPALCEYLIGRGALTRYQADAIASGRGLDLTYAGYAVRDSFGPCPCGTAFRATHADPARSIILRKIEPEQLSPFDTVDAYLARAEAASQMIHPNLNVPQEIGRERGEPFVVVVPIEGADFQKLIEDIGPMPVLLAAEYIRQAALGLAAAHARAVVHGDVRPATLSAGPLVPMNKPRADGTPRFRPGPTATVRVNELGLVPLRGKSTDWPTNWDTAYLPPERRTTGEQTPSGDVAMLGGVLVFLLTGRAPTNAALFTARPDCPPELVRFIEKMRSADPASRPTMAEVATTLGQFVQGGKMATPAPANNPDVFEVPLSDEKIKPVLPGLAQGWNALAEKSSTDAGTESPGAAWDLPTQDPNQPSVSSSYRRPERTMSRKTLWLWVGAFVLMNVLAVLIWLALLLK